LNTAGISFLTKTSEATTTNKEIASTSWGLLGCDTM